MELLIVFRRVVCAVLLLCLPPFLHYAQGAEEYEVKAAFLYNFVKFVTWPSEAFPDESSLSLCILGEDPFGGAIDALQGEPAGDRKMVVRRVQDVQGVRKCQLLFISRSEKERLSHILGALKGASVLTVGDTAGFAEQGVIINFYMEKGRVRFEINGQSADRAGLGVSAKLLSLAKPVQERR